MRFLAGLYPRHIAKEDKQFFIPSMEHFSAEERDAMLEEEREFDRKFIHKLYEDKVEGAEKSSKA